MKESSRKERWIQISMYSQGSCCFSKVGEASHASKPMKKSWRNHWRFCRKNIQQMSLCAHVFRLQFWDPCWFHVISQTSVCMWFKQGFFCHICVWEHVWVFWIGWRNGGIVFWSWSSVHSRVRWFSWKSPVLRGIICVWTWGWWECPRSWIQFWGDDWWSFYSSASCDCVRLLHHNFRQVFAYCCLPSWQKSWSEDLSSQDLHEVFVKWHQEVSTHFWSLCGLEWMCSSIPSLWRFSS